MIYWIKDGKGDFLPAVKCDSSVPSSHPTCAR